MNINEWTLFNRFDPHNVETWMRVRRDHRLEASVQVPCECGWHRFVGSTVNEKCPVDHFLGAFTRSSVIEQGAAPNGYTCLVFLVDRCS